MASETRPAARNAPASCATTASNTWSDGSDPGALSPKSGARATQASAPLRRDAWAPSSRARRASPRRLYSPVAWSTSPSSRARSAARLTRVNVSSFKSRCSASSGWPRYSQAPARSASMRCWRVAWSELRMMIGVSGANSGSCRSARQISNGS